MNEIKEKIETKELKAGEKVKIKVPIEGLDHTEHIEYITDKKGLEFFKEQIGPGAFNYKQFEGIVATGKRERLGDYLERIRADNPENYLTFIDGVLVTWRIFDRILKKRLTDENGEPEKDNNGCDYLGIINDDITDMLVDSVLEYGYFKTRGYQLMYQFGININ